MSKKKKRIIILLIVAAVIVAAALGIRHFLYNGISASEKDRIAGEVQQMADEVFKQIEEERAYQEEHGIDDAESIANIIKNDGNVEPRDEEEINKTVVSDANSWSGQAKQVVARYYNGLLSLQGKANGMVDGLLSSAMADYNSVVSSGGDKSQLASLASSYSSRANAMESSVTSSVNSLLAGMRSELEACGVSKSEIDAQVSSFKSTYEAQKEARRSSVMSKVGSL